jgi:fructose transport system ATP-binding protein
MDPPTWECPVTATQTGRTPLLSARGLVKTYGPVVALDGANLDLYEGEILALIGDNGAGKSTLIKCLTGAELPDVGRLELAGQEVHFKRPQDAREAGIETVYQTLPLAPALDIATNVFLGRELRRPGPLGKVLRLLDHPEMRKQAEEKVKALGIRTIQNITQVVETLSGGQRQAVAIARAVAFGSRIIVMDEPTAALGVRETAHVLEVIKELRQRGLSIILISHNMPNVFEVSDRIQVLRLGQSAAVISPQTHTPADAVAIMTGAVQVAADHADPGDAE